MSFNSLGVLVWGRRGRGGRHKIEGGGRGDDLAALENLGCAWLTRPQLSPARCARSQSCPAGRTLALLPRHWESGIDPALGAEQGCAWARRAAWIPPRCPRSAFSLPPGRGRGARRRGGAGLGVGAHSPCSRLPAPRPSRGRRRPTARPGTCQPRAACTDFPEGRRDLHGDFLDSGWFAGCPPSPTPEATDRSPAAPARRRGPSSRVPCPLRGVSGSPAPGGLCRGSAVAAAGSEHRRGRAGHLRCHCSLRGAQEAGGWGGDCDTQSPDWVGVAENKGEGHSLFVGLSRQ